MDQQQLLVLNFDDPDAAVVEEIIATTKSGNSLNSTHTGQVSKQTSAPNSAAKVPTAQQQQQPQNFDPNIQEYEGIDGLPHQIWDPLTYDKRADYMHALGLEVLPEDESHNRLNFLVWSKFVMKPK